MNEHADAYGCLYCTTGQEQALAELIEYKCPDVSVRTAKYVKYRTHQGVHRQETRIFLPGYVFFRCRDDVFVPGDFPKDSFFKLLKNEHGDWRLMGSDYAFAQWLFSYDGLIQFSRASEKDKRVEWISGPLKDMEKEIIRVDRRGRSALISLCFQNRCFKIWLGYELVDSDGQQDDGPEAS